MSPCLTPTLKSMDFSTFPMMILTMLFLYMRLISEYSLGGEPYFPSMAMINAWLGVSKSLTRSAIDTHVGRLWLCIICIIFFIVNVPYWHPNPGVDPHWNFMPCLLIIFNIYPHIIVLYILLPISIWVTPIHLLVLEVSPFWSIGTTWHSCHSSKSYCLCQIWFKNSRIQEGFTSLIDLNALDGTPLSPGTLSFANFVVGFLSHTMIWGDLVCT